MVKPKLFSKATRKSKTFSRLHRPSLNDVLKARRVLGIETANFNYDADDDVTRRKASPKERKPSREDRKLSTEDQKWSPEDRKLSPKDRKLLKKRLLLRKDGGAAKRKEVLKRDAAARTIQINGEEFDIDNIEALVDNQPVDDDGDDSGDDARSDTSPKLSGKHVCGACGTSFINRHGLEMHERTQLTCKPFSCNVCNKRWD